MQIFVKDTVSLQTYSPIILKLLAKQKKIMFRNKVLSRPSSSRLNSFLSQSARTEFQLQLHITPSLLKPISL